MHTSTRYVRAGAWYARIESPSSRRPQMTGETVLLLQYKTQIRELMHQLDELKVPSGEIERLKQEKEQVGWGGVCCCAQTHNTVDIDTRPSGGRGFARERDAYTCVARACATTHGSHSDFKRRPFACGRTGTYASMWWRSGRRQATCHLTLQSETDKLEHIRLQRHSMAGKGGTPMDALLNMGQVPKDNDKAEREARQRKRLEELKVGICLMAPRGLPFPP